MTKPTTKNNNNTRKRPMVRPRGFIGSGQICSHWGCGVMECYQNQNVDSEGDAIMNSPTTTTTTTSPTTTPTTTAICVPIIDTSIPEDQPLTTHARQPSVVSLSSQPDMTMIAPEDHHHHEPSV
eukprot:CAMPEP_0117072120 /NCGR_PEP_ID=MMETSP0472-20121206/50728_1 /TAXON_ID=693140 ORGANISM="Tiarina fusus, Strain LIS" /NCGR_SAMPLE_ID=MMETSP0472 /ASSEMBLY_ACC=CAM_ASM_000603 /LENGTH=123 /DNA_ID=CAMNT_0004796027 /DNA_START=55 /DNA_END=423 /DNA_ORIENTATION=+